MTSEARKALSSTLRALRARLIEDLGHATEGLYRLGHAAQHVGLDETTAVRRRRLEAHAEEQQRAEAAQRTARPLAAHVADVVKQAAYTHLNRHVLLRILEARPEGGARALRETPVLSGGWRSRGYLDFRALAPALVAGDPTEGFGFLLALVFEDLAEELPGLFGPAGAAELIPVPPATLRHLVETLEVAELTSCWSDDMTLGWVYQYWNDPEREALDAKINEGGKIEPHELASKTQLFTERYMVDWLLQNALLPQWKAICARNGWVPEVEADGTLARLEARRVAWRARREAGEVPLTALMPLHSENERRWAYHVPQPLSDGAAERAPDSLRDLRMIDPAVGSGHFLVVALDQLFALYQEEARHRGLVGDPDWTDRAIVERILSHNLHGIDIDPRAVQIAAASLWVKAQQLARGARPTRLGLVAANLRLASLPDGDAALVELRARLSEDVGIPYALTNDILYALRGADHLGSLLQVDTAVESALSQHEEALGRVEPEQGGLFTGFSGARKRQAITVEQARTTVIGRIESFLAEHSSGDDLGLRLRGEQLAAGVRFVRMLKEGSYDLVVANPPYQGTGKMADSAYVARHYPLGKADLYAAFLLRGLQLAKVGGTSAMLTMRNWMFIKTYAGLREDLFGRHDLRALGDYETGAFEEIGGIVVSVTTSVFRRGLTSQQASLAVRPGEAEGTSGERTLRKRAATLCHVGSQTFEPQALKVVPEWPLVYWWDEAMLRAYQSAPLIGRVAKARVGLATQDNTRFLRKTHEVLSRRNAYSVTDSTNGLLSAWAPYIKGAAGRCWIEPSSDAVLWRHSGLTLWNWIEFYRTKTPGQYIKNSDYYFRRGVAFSPIGASFEARVHRVPSIFGAMGSSVFPEDLAGAVCAMNSRRAREILAGLNPGVHFEVGDVNRLPLFPIANADAIFANVEAAFGVHESHREPSVEFKRPGPSPWEHAQAWAQEAVDRQEGAPLPPYVERSEPEPAWHHLSFALGVALGRFDVDGAGVLDPATANLSRALPAGVLVLDGTLDPHAAGDDLSLPACAPLRAAWEQHGGALGTTRANLRDWLRLDFFALHKGMYDNRPIHWPLSSARKTFVAWVNIHRMGIDTLDEVRVRLQDTAARLNGERADLDVVRQGQGPAATKAERRFAKVADWLAELENFLAELERCGWVGAPTTGAGCRAREQDARYAPNLDDGVMINSAALWPLLDPQWRDPKKWWTELSRAEGRKDYDWSHLARRYWPARVDAKCGDDPSLAVAHGCFWRYHPARAWAWELRLQDEIGPDFRIEEGPYTDGAGEESPGHEELRKSWLAREALAARIAIKTEAYRRARKGRLEDGITSDGDRTLAMRIREPGLWFPDPSQCWDLEWQVSHKLGIPFFLRAPDDSDARAFLAATMREVLAMREEELRGLTQVALFEAEDAACDVAVGDDEDA